MPDLPIGASIGFSWRWSDAFSWGWYPVKSDGPRGLFNASYAWVLALGPLTIWRLRRDCD